MTAFFIIVKVITLLTILVLPLIGPEKKKTPTPKGMSNFAVNEDGYLEYATVEVKDHYRVL